LKMGIRWDFHPRMPNRKHLFKWGVDAFLITPEIAGSLPDFGFAMGCPGWDYWIPWHLQTLGYQFQTYKDMYLMHEAHRQSWTNADYKAWLDVMSREYKTNNTDVTEFVQRITGREQTRYIRLVR
jgi:hypothetical protein